MTEIGTLGTTCSRVSAAVQSERLWSRHQRISEFGQISEGGVSRQALTAEDLKARCQLVEWARQRTFKITTDAIGNLFISREGSEPELPPIVTGSHLDTQPAAGNFDGVYGVLAAFEVLEALADLRIMTRRTIHAVVWTNEEGVRFAPGLMGSGAFTGAFQVGSLLEARDAQGISVAESLQQFELLLGPESLVRGATFVPHAYIEAHIEQGPVLERRGATIGVVTGIQGIRQYDVSVRGEAGHAGTVPTGARRDALRQAVSLAESLYTAFSEPNDDTRFTIGRLAVSPGGRSTIPDRVEFTIDLRHPNLATLQQAERKIAELGERSANRCQVSLTCTLARDPTQFEPALIRLIGAEAERQGLTYIEMPSGAGHDAMMLSEICPAGMIFIPCKDGVSHNVRESAHKDHVAAGARVLAEVVHRLAMV